MNLAPPSHLSPAAAAYLLDPDVLDYPTDWTDPWDVHAIREVAHPLWSSMNDVLDFPYTVIDDIVAGVPCERIRGGESESADTVVLHLHGGMYCLGTPEIDRVFNAPLSRATGLDVVSVDYRLAPEHPFPAALDDTLAVWATLANAGRRLVVVGESAGGGLAAAAALRARDDGLTMAAALVLISPMLDLTGASDTYATLTAADPDYGTDPKILLGPARAYAGDTSLEHPLVSPLFADLVGLPPTLVHVGNREVLFGDSARFVQRARAAGCDVDMHVLDGGWHNSPMWFGIPEADRAINDIASFINKAVR